KIAHAAQVRFMVIPDSSAAKAALISGAVDMMSDVASTELSDLRARRDVRVATAPTMGLTGFLIQTRDPLLRDPRMRQALALSIDV
ncbi:ABC transporter substrate-binding protein, partial [Acinetobacter baumannii]